MPGWLTLAELKGVLDKRTKGAVKQLNERRASAQSEHAATAGAAAGSTGRAGKAATRVRAVMGAGRAGLTVASIMGLRDEFPDFLTARLTVGTPDLSRKIAALWTTACSQAHRFEHPLPAGWKFRLNKNRGAYGKANYTNRTVFISMRQFLGDGVVPLGLLDTMLHEIAHASVGPGHGHDLVWRTAAIK